MTKRTSASAGLGVPAAHFAERSEHFFAEALLLFPGGVNAPSRAYLQTNGNDPWGTPRFLDRGDGAYVLDVDGNRYVDYTLSGGALLMGHGVQTIRDAITESVQQGVSFGAPTRVELELAHLLCAWFPSIEQIRFVSSVTEAVMSAIRLARAYTGRRYIVKFDGCYHGHADVMLARAGASRAAGTVPDSPGVSPLAAAETLVVPYNDCAAVRELFARMGDDIAAVIAEPVATHMGVVAPNVDFLPLLREITRAYEALLIFDESVTAFRVHPVSAQAHYNITPDLTVLGPALGAGFDIGSYGGRRAIMELVAPLGPIWQDGTHTSPVVITAGIAALRAFESTNAWTRAERFAAALSDGLIDVARLADTQIIQSRVGTMLSMSFADSAAHDLKSARTVDAHRFSQLFHLMLRNGVYLPPTPWGTWFTSSEHGNAELEWTLRAVYRSFKAMT